MDKFTMYTVTNTITEESASRGDYASMEATDPEPVSFREALDALTGGCWDSLDWQADTVIAYPADYSQDFRTGDYVGVEVIIKAGRPEWLDRLAVAYTHTRRSQT